LRRVLVAGAVATGVAVAGRAAVTNAGGDVAPPVALLLSGGPAAVAYLAAATRLGLPEVPALVAISRRGMRRIWRRLPGPR
ncbi:MAG: hypothetical protein M3507_00815, partial [Actinomycetota bacterium]|nr:hypothetical protein [Actinomycetota bacterium]